MAKNTGGKTLLSLLASLSLLTPVSSADCVGLCLTSHWVHASTQGTGQGDGPAILWEEMAGRNPVGLGASKTPDLRGKESCYREGGREGGR